jgi:hypothetical protein
VANSYIHAQASARHFGGTPEDYIAIHEFIDSSKKSIADPRHRSMYHNTQGPWLVQEIFGRYITITGKDGKEKRVPTREVAENHIVEDLGWIPSPADWLSCMECKVWMSGKRNKFIGREELLESTVNIPNPTRTQSDD